MEVSDRNALTIAYKKGIEIRFAEDMDYIWEDGVHVYKPSPDEFLDAVQDAIRYGERLLVIHSTVKTWPFEFFY